MAKKTIRDVPLRDRRVLIRVDFNVPLTPDGAISNDRRIRAALPTIQAALDGGASVILMTHLGRPSGDPAKDRRLQTVAIAARLGDLLRQPIRYDDKVVGPDVTRVARSLKPGEVFVLENLRFHPGEKSGDEGFAAQLAELADLYVNDAFGTCHRNDASVVAVPRKFPPGNRVAGLLLEKELTVLDKLLTHPDEPMIALMGGAKVSDKIKVIENLIPRVECLLIGGAMSFTFRAAQGLAVGKSLVETEALDTARQLAESCGSKLMLPSDHVAAEKLEDSAQTQIVSSEQFPDNLAGADIGPATVRRFEAQIRRAGTVVWNGPVGKFELQPFSHGTRAIAQAMAEADAVTVVGGGETAEAVEQFGLADQMTHVSTGGGAFLEYMAGDQFESLAALDDK